MRVVVKSLLLLRKFRSLFDDNSELSIAQVLGLLLSGVPEICIYVRPHMRGCEVSDLDVLMRKAWNGRSSGLILDTSLRLQIASPETQIKLRG